MPPTTNTAGNPFLTRAYGLSSVDDCRQLYDDWAASYDTDLTSAAQDYVAPDRVLQAVFAVNGKITGEIFDAGCGTGLSGIPLAQQGAKNIDGVDLSPEMLKIAEKTGVYRSLATADLTKEIDKGDGVYDVVICVGTLTHGHVGPVPALKEFVRIAKAGGVIVATVLDDIWVEGGFEAEVERLRREGLVKVASTEREDYRKGAGVQARILIMFKL